ncbi:hypothetical protein CXP39_01965 [Mesoplasma syrphidae]|uniref:Uncharacterized protein n=1 Tax=Mesoplasma syrphidae TaxID=225999 RepID=A0A2K9C5J0_9MOLU|nr:hypothetical protein [Mesoplasma syrphidae]AUF83557.1 hypothetical protein CXP39_01965 [Mesoplasma syrphidae]
MRQIILIFYRNFKISISSLTKATTTIIFFGILIPLMTIAPISQIFGTGNISNNLFVNNGILIKVSIISGLLIYIAKKMRKDFKNGFLKNLFVNNITKQQYFFGNIIYWTIFILISSIISLAFFIILCNTGNIKINETLYTKALFYLSYFFAIPIFSF